MELEPHYFIVPIMVYNQKIKTRLKCDTIARSPAFSMVCSEKKLSSIYNNVMEGSAFRRHFFVSSMALLDIRFSPTEEDTNGETVIFLPFTFSRVTL